MKNLLKVIVKFFLYIVGKLLIKINLLDEFILIRIDGGICSQMHFFLIGNFFESKGYKVKYDVSWFDEYGMDLTGQYVRNFDLLNAFPTIQFKCSNKFENFIYKGFQYHNNYYDDYSLNWVNCKAPTFLTGYYRDPIGFYMDFSSLFKIDKTILDEKNKQVLGIIEEKSAAVAIHVRRGDLGSFSSAYGAPVDVEYFKKAIGYIGEQIETPYYFFFSDDTDWVRNVLVPEIGDELLYDVVDINGSDKGYFDLFLISSCKHQITSKGTLGKYGAFLCKNMNNIITIYDDLYERKSWDKQHKNIVFIK